MERIIKLIRNENVSDKNIPVCIPDEYGMAHIHIVKYFL